MTREPLLKHMLSPQFIFKNNNVRPVSGVKLCQKLPPFVSKSVIAELNALDENLQRLHRERVKWQRDAAEAEIRRRRDVAQSNPTPDALAQLSSEGQDELRKRYEDAEREIRAVYDLHKNKAYPVMVGILEAFERVLQIEMGEVEEAHRTAFETYGLSYNREEDGVLKALAKFAEIARIRLGNKRSVIAPNELRELFGELKPISFFS